MPRYLVERTFSDGLGITPDDDGARACLSVVQNNAERGRDVAPLVRHGGPAQDLLHSTTGLRLKRSGRARRGTDCQSTRSFPSACSTPTSTTQRPRRHTCAKS